MSATDELKPCPLCGKEVYGQLCGGSGLFSDEYEYEIECKCGLLFNAGPFRTPKKAKAETVKMWNRRTYDRD
jgi:hypothetical protein